MAFTKLWARQLFCVSHSHSPKDSEFRQATASHIFGSHFASWMAASVCYTASSVLSSDTLCSLYGILVDRFTAITRHSYSFPLGSGHTKAHHRAGRSCSTVLVFHGGVPSTVQCILRQLAGFCDLRSPVYSENVGVPGKGSRHKMVPYSNTLFPLWSCSSYAYTLTEVATFLPYGVHCYPLSITQQLLALLETAWKFTNSWIQIDFYEDSFDI